MMQQSLLIVGAFPAGPDASEVRGGMRQSCELLLESTLPSRVRLTTLDSTQRSVPPPGFLRRLVLAAARCLRFVRQLRRDRPAFVLVFASGGASFVEKSLLLHYARLQGARTLMFMRHGAFMQHCRQSRSYRWFARTLLRGISVHLCQSETWRRFFTAELGLPAARCRVVENWTVTESLLAIGERRVYGQRAQLTFVFVGWLEAAKGVPELFEAFERVLREPGLPPSRLVLAGSGSLEAYCRERIERSNLGSCVTLRGWVSGADKEELLASSDVFVLPSHAEGLSNSMLEAMAVGLPVIVTRVGSLPDVVVDDVQGLLVQPRDVEALAASMITVARDAQRRERLGRAARARAEGFRVERAVADLLSVMDDCAPPGRGGAER